MSDTNISLFVNSFDLCKICKSTKLEFIGIVNNFKILERGKIWSGNMGIFLLFVL